jgi:cholest-4-en-3-one 26-monooxygenase
MDLREIDLTDPDHFAAGTPHGWFRALRAQDPVHWQPEADGPGFWCVTKYDDLKQVSRHPELFSSWLGATNIHTPPPEGLARTRMIMLNMDPPQHVKFRRIVQRGFTPRRVAQQQAHIRELARRIVDAVAPRGEAEFVEELAAELPLQVICEMMGVPLEDRKLLFDLSNTMIGFDDPEMGDEASRMAASTSIFGYAMQLAERYKAKPADNLTTILLRGEVDGENLSEVEYCSFFLLLCIAGNETTRTVTTNGWKLLMDHPDQLELLVREPARIPDAVEEILRFDPAVHYFRRTATQDTEIRGRRIRKGDKVVMWYLSGNRDETAIDDPDAFVIDRPRPRQHLSFGFGIHRCVGNRLAELQLRILWEEILPRFERIEVVGPPQRVFSNFVRGYTHLPVRIPA